MPQGIPIINPFPTMSRDDSIRIIHAIQDGMDYLRSIFRSEPVDITDPNSVRGKTPKEVEDAAKAKGLTETPANNGKGKRFSDKSGNNGIRVMDGGDRRGDPVNGAVKEGGPYAVIFGGKNAGEVVPLAGNKAL